MQTEFASFAIREAHFGFAAALTWLRPEKKSRVPNILRS
jgi:hypothetical protein